MASRHSQPRTRGAAEDRVTASPGRWSQRWWDPRTWRTFGGGCGPIMITDDVCDVPVFLGWREAMQVSALWAAGRIIADNLGQVPLEAWDVSRWTGDPLSANMPATFAGVPGVLHKPEADSGRMATIHKLVWSLLLHGNMVAIIDRSVTRNDTADNLWVLDPERVQLEHDTAGYRRYSYLGGDGTYRVISNDRIGHVPWIVTPHSDWGVGVLAAFGSSGPRLGLALSRFLHSALTDGGVPSVVITTSRDLTEQQAESLKARWMHRLRGRRLPMVVNQGITVQPITGDPTLVTQAQAMWNLVCLEVSNITGIPASDLNGAVPGSTLTYNNLESVQRNRVAGLRPWAVRLEELFTGCLPHTHRAMFDLDLLTRGEMPARYAAYSTGITGGFLTVDEVRRQENLPPLPGAPLVEAPSGAGASNVTPFAAAVKPPRQPMILQANGSDGP